VLCLPEGDGSGGRGKTRGRGGDPGGSLPSPLGKRASARS